ncbi:helix-turn-helix domain-containing protein [Nocardia iowensis]|uniref:Helix-turn-helix domain-containing protein n=1 Tax=Nocardia iowensis TaxID=204891 RepID=A0ABX8S0S0_NOCIO|nr:helix-turn-helix domain-containing protein [Nocardia iowensis]
MFSSVVADSQPESSEVPENEREELTPRQAAAAIFASRLSGLIDKSVVSTEDGTTRGLTLYSLAQHLELAYPDVPVSQSGLYRLIHGDAIPRLDLIIALARVFDVPPEYFVTEAKRG